MKIAILDDYQNVVKSLVCYQKLEQHEVTVFTESYLEDELALKLHDFEALVLIRERTEITESLLSKLPNLKLISQTGKVSNHIDPHMCERFGVKVLEGRGSPVAPSELCWALIMAASRHIPTYSSNLKQNQWQDSGSLGLGRTLKELKARHLGLWKNRTLHRAICQSIRNGCDGVGSQTSRDQAQADGFEAAEDKHAFFSNVDVLSLHLRLNDATRGCVTADDLGLMKPDSLFVNISRAELVETKALFNELTKVASKRAAIDVLK